MYFLKITLEKYMNINADLSLILESLNIVMISNIIRIKIIMFNYA